MCVIHPVVAAFLYACMYAVIIALSCFIFCAAVCACCGTHACSSSFLIHAALGSFFTVVLVCSDGDGFVNKVLSLVVLACVLAQTITFQLV